MSAPSRSTLLEKARRGAAVTSIDKIGSLACLQEVSGFEWVAKTYGPPLTRPEQDALARRKVELKYGRRVG